MNLGREHLQKQESSNLEREKNEQYVRAEGTFLTGAHLPI